MLDGLRGLAALSVLVVHVFGELRLHTLSKNAPIEQLVPHVHLAVDFFFMLSGFVIAKAYETRLATSMSFSRFISIRLVRLYPLIFIGVVLGTLSMSFRVAITHTPSWRDLFVATLSAFAILPTTALLSVFPGELFPVDFPEWSLSCEVAVNVLYSMILPWLTSQKLIAVCILSLLALCFVAYSSNLLLDFGMGVHPVGIIPIDFWCGFIRVSFPFFCGVLLFRQRFAWHTGDAIGILLCGSFIMILFAPVFGHSWAYEITAVAVMFPVILAVGATCRCSPTLSKPFLFLGQLSYPLYITHNPITKLFINIVKVLHINMPASILAFLCCSIAILAALVLLKWWDRPVREWMLQNFASR